MTPLQLGVVLLMVGIGFLYLRNSVPDVMIPLLVFGTLALMLGIGFIAAAGISWVLARQLGIFPPGSPALPGKNPAHEGQQRQ